MRAFKGMRGCLPACLSVTRMVVGGGGGGGGTLFIFINFIRVPPSPGLVSVFVCLFVSTGIPCPGLQQTLFPLCLKYDLFRKTILTNLNMLSVDHVLCER